MRTGEDVCYYQNSRRKKGSKFLYTVTFTVTFPHEQDCVYFAYCYPYTYTDLRRDLIALEKKPQMRQRMRRRKLCDTLAGNQVLRALPTPHVSEGFLCRCDTSFPSTDAPDATHPNSNPMHGRPPPRRTSSPSTHPCPGLEPGGPPHHYGI